MTKEELEQLNTTFTEFKQVNERALAEVKKFGDATGETQAKLEKLNGKLDTLETKINDRETAETKAMKDFQDGLMVKISALETALARRTAGVGGGEEKAAAAQQRIDVFFKALKSGHNSRTVKEVLTADEFKVLQLGSDPAGGYLAPMEYVASILKDVVQFSPLRAIVTVRPTSRVAIGIPRRTQTAAAQWVAEMGDRNETQNPAFGLETLNTHEMYAMTKITHAELEDAAFDMQGFMQAEFSEQFGVTEGAAFCTGTGQGQPEGVLVRSDVGFISSGATGAITPDNLIDLYFELKEQYTNTATFAMSRSTLKTVRKFKDGDGNYLWTPGIKTDARPATILDRPYVICPDFPTIASNNYPIAFGDFARAYIIADRLEIEFMVDPYTSKKNGMVEFSARKRVGGQVVLADAMKRLKVS